METTICGVCTSTHPKTQARCPKCGTEQLGARPIEAHGGSIAQLGWRAAIVVSTLLGGGAVYAAVGAPAPTPVASPDIMGHCGEGEFGEPLGAAVSPAIAEVLVAVAPPPIPAIDPELQKLLEKWNSLKTTMAREDFAKSLEGRRIVWVAFVSDVRNGLNGPEVVVSLRRHESAGKELLSLVSLQDTLTEVPVSKAFAKTLAPGQPVRLSGRLGSTNNLLGVLVFEVRQPSFQTWK